MENAQQILVYTFAGFLTISVIITFRRSIAALGAYLGNGDFKYRFDKTRLPICGSVLLTILIFSLLYGLIITMDIDTALSFCLMTTFLGTITCLLRICYVPKDK